MIARGRSQIQLEMALTPNLRLLGGWLLTGFMVTFSAVRPLRAQDDPYRGERSPESQAQVDTYLKKVRSIEFGKEQIRDAPAGGLSETEFAVLPKALRSQIYNRLNSSPQ